MRVFGRLDDRVRSVLEGIVSASTGALVQRRNEARSATPFPSSEDLERAVAQTFQEAGFAHHVRVAHPRAREGFVYDFFQEKLGVAVEIMGYRGDDEAYKDALKFHVHPGTRVGVLWVSRYKWISGKRSDANHRAALKALAFAEDFLAVQALVAITYDWVVVDGARWRLVYPSEPGSPA